jgi:hypothetical protein
MQYTKVQLNWVRSEIFTSAEPAARGVWLSLIAYCADQENGGRIAACQGWTDRRWMAAAAASSAEVAQVVQAGLARWDGEDLEVRGYDTVGEKAFQAASGTNQARANGRWEKERQRKGAKVATDTVPRATMPPVVPAVMPPASKQDAPGNAAGMQNRMRPAMPPAMPIHPSIHTREAVDAGAREAPATAPGDDLDEPDLPDAIAQAQALATGLGGRQGVVDGDPVGPRWLGVFRGLTPQQVQAIWVGAGEPITLPSQFDRARKAWRQAQAVADQQGLAQAEERRRQAQAAQQAKIDAERIARASAGSAERLRRLRQLIAATQADPSLQADLPETEGRRWARVMADVAAGNESAADLAMITLGPRLPAEMRRHLDSPAPVGAAS